jgi:GMP synthase (glutamine-hydrolysing)
MLHAPKSALVLSHIAFEDLGTLDPPLREHGFSIKSLAAATTRFPLPQAQACDLLVVLGGPIGVYEQRKYPFLTDEIALIRQRLAARRPVLGICLGAQLMAAALRARVFPGENGKEIGWAPIQPGPDAARAPWLAPLFSPGLSVFHWHGDTFDLPAGALHLARTESYPNQAFAIGDFALALQFHTEVIAADLESWYVGHACELHHAGIAVESLRAGASQHGPGLEAAAAQFWNLWLDHIL